MPLLDLHSLHRALKYASHEDRRVTSEVLYTHPWATESSLLLLSDLAWASFIVERKCRLRPLFSSGEISARSRMSISRGWTEFSQISCNITGSFISVYNVNCLKWYRRIVNFVLLIDKVKFILKKKNLFDSKRQSYLVFFIKRNCSTKLDSQGYCCVLSPGSSHCNCIALSRQRREIARNFFSRDIAVEIDELFTCVRKNFLTCRNSIEWTL